MTCSEYLHQIRQTADELAFAGSPVSSGDLALIVLNGLGPDYNPFVMAANTRNDPLSFSDLHGLLLSHEALPNSQSAPLTTTNSTTSLPSLASPPAFYNNTSRSTYNGSSN